MLSAQLYVVRLELNRDHHATYDLSALRLSCKAWMLIRANAAPAGAVPGIMMQEAITIFRSPPRAHSISRYRHKKAPAVGGTAGGGADGETRQRDCVTRRWQKGARRGNRQIRCRRP